MYERKNWAVHVFAAAFSSLVLLSACGSSSNDPAGNGPNSPPPVDQPSSPNADMSLFGQWVSTCRDAEAFGLTEDSLLRFEGVSFTRLTRVSAAGDCSSTIVEVRRDGTYASGMELRDGVRAIDFTSSKLTIKPVTETGVAILRLANFCGIADWALGVEREVTAQSGGLRCFDRVPAAIFDIYSVDGGRLFFGLAGGDRSMRANRPTELDRQNVFAQK